MKEEYSYERLETLRKIVKLDLISIFKLKLLKNKIEKLIDIKLTTNSAIEIPNEEELLKCEYYLRMKKWVNLCENAWHSYLKIENDGCGLFEFANGNLNRIVEEKRKKLEK